MVTIVLLRPARMHARPWGTFFLFFLRLTGATASAASSPSFAPLGASSFAFLASGDRLMGRSSAAAGAFFSGSAIGEVYVLVRVTRPESPVFFFPRRVRALRRVGRPRTGTLRPR